MSMILIIRVIIIIYKGNTTSMTSDKQHEDFEYLTHLITRILVALSNK